MVTPFPSASREFAADGCADLFRAAGRLAEAAVPGLADIVAVEVSEPALRGDAPAPGPVRTDTAFHRLAFHCVREAGIRPAYRLGEVSRIPPTTAFRRSLTDLSPRLVRHLDREGRCLVWDGARARVMREARVHSLIVVPLVVRGAVLGLAALYRRAGSAPFTADDVAVAASFAERAAVCLDVVRGRIRERARARLLQHSLLPEALPSLSALEEARGHLPADGCGGEWFDVIPLSGARVALVVGVADGAGTDAAAQMSRVRAMITALAVMDLAPEEILARLEEVLTRLAGPRAPDGPGRPGCSCVCALYDPVAGHCVAVRAGDAHLLVVGPDGRVALPGLPPHPPLGGDGPPFETAEADVAPGSVLIADSAGPGLPPPDADALREGLRQVAGGSAPGVAEALDAVRRLLPPGRTVPLLAARVRALADGSVAVRTLPPETAAVAAARTWTARQLAHWARRDLTDTTVLVVSELVTNAVRYAAGPVQVRLINDGRTLICEVCDTSDAAPHLRKPTVCDEGGRGLFVVAQLTRHQGVRYTARGKTVWTEQPLTAA